MGGFGETGLNSGSDTEPDITWDPCERIWAARRATGSLMRCVSCPLSRRHRCSKTKKQSNGA